MRTRWPSGTVCSTPQATTGDRSEIYWADLGTPSGSRPADRASQLPAHFMHKVDRGLRRVLGR
ncbi:hypothetical protein H7H82_09250 [Mycobacterium heidelbergense]|nr:hypothetical protein [Mycobacterium heidelbergense]